MLERGGVTRGIEAAEYSAHGGCTEKKMAYHGAKNLRNTVFPSVEAAKLSGVRESTAADAPAVRLASVRRKNFIILINFLKRCWVQEMKLMCKIENG